MGIKKERFVRRAPPGAKLTPLHKSSHVPFSPSAPPPPPPPGKGHRQGKLPLTAPPPPVNHNAQTISDDHTDTATTTSTPKQWRGKLNDNRNKPLATPPPKADNLPPPPRPPKGSVSPNNKPKMGWKVESRGADDVWIFNDNARSLSFFSLRLFSTFLYRLPRRWRLRTPNGRKQSDSSAQRAAPLASSLLDSPKIMLSSVGCHYLAIDCSSSSLLQVLKGSVTVMADYYANLIGID